MRRSLRLGVALVLGLGVGFVAGAHPVISEPGPVGICTRNSDCDGPCGGKGQGFCSGGICGCL
jgi:hypothetical protein